MSCVYDNLYEAMPHGKRGFVTVHPSEPGVLTLGAAFIDRQIDKDQGHRHFCLCAQAEMPVPLRINYLMVNRERWGLDCIALPTPPSRKIALQMD